MTHKNLSETVVLLAIYIHALASFGDWTPCQYQILAYPIPLDTMAYTFT
jgi:hypothetical protein